MKKVKVVFNVYKNKKGKVSIVPQCDSNKAEAEEIRDEFEIKPEKSHREIAHDFAIFIDNRNDTKLLKPEKDKGDAWRVEAEMEVNDTSE